MRVRGSTPRARAEARERFLEPLLDIARRNGGHLPEIADAEPTHTPRGCPWQAWSVAEVLRLELSVLGGTADGGIRTPGLELAGADAAAVPS